MDSVKRSGLTLVEVIVVVAIVAVLAALVLPAIFLARVSARRAQCASRLREVGVALTLHEQHHGSFPRPFAHFGPHVALLPYLGHKPLFDLLRPYDPNHPANGQLLNMTIPQLLCPAHPENGRVFEPQLSASMPAPGSPPTGQTQWTPVTFGHYAVDYAACYSSGKWGDALPNAEYGSALFDGAFLRRGPPLRSAFIRDGLEQTVVFSEWKHHTDYVPWKPAFADHEHFARECLAHEDGSSGLPPFTPVIGAFWFDGEPGHSSYNHLLPPNSKSCKTGHLGNSAYSAASYHGKGVNALFAGGSVRFVNQSIDLSTWRALASISRGEVVSAEF